MEEYWTGMMGNNNNMGASQTQNYFQELEKVTAMMTVADILCTAEFNLPGCGTDWYWVLQIDVNADESEIELKYKSLISLLEPIKDKFPGKDSALNLVKCAYAVLSDRKKRHEFDLKRAASWETYGSVNQEHLSPEIMNNGKDATSQSSGSKTIAREFSDASEKELPSKRATDLAGYDLDIAVESQVIAESIEKISIQEESWKSACDKAKAKGVEFCLAFGSPASPVKIITSKAPDLDFHDFGKNRNPEAFAVGQIWAAYDSENMPRNYALIDDIKLSPFQLNVTWLKPAPVDPDVRRWHEVGLPVSCGYFKMDKCDMVVSGRWVFSHLVTPVHDSTNASLEIYPQKGEVWGIYTDTRLSDWRSDPVTMDGCKIQPVEILTEYSKKTGVRVARLEKVAGFRSIFRRYMDKESEFSFQISPANLFLFSHNIPAVRSTDGEIDSFSDGMLELDPSSIPEDLVMDTYGIENHGIPEGALHLEPDALPPIFSN